MGLLESAVKSMGRSEWFKKVGPKVVHRMDGFVHKITKGKVLPSTYMMDGLVLTSIGRKSGLERTVPISCFHIDGDLVVIGTNYGQDHHPAWALNLEANPEARVVYKGEEFEVTAHMVTDVDETERIFAHAQERWPAYEVYRERVAKAGRDIKMFRLKR